MKYLLIKASDYRMAKFENIYANVNLERTEKGIDDDDYNIYTIDIDSMESLNTLIKCVGKVIIEETKEEQAFWWLCYGSDMEFVKSFPYTIMIYDTYVE